jgi:hypothetical protein
MCRLRYTLLDPHSVINLTSLQQDLSKMTVALLYQLLYRHLLPQQNHLGQLQRSILAAMYSTSSTPPARYLPWHSCMAMTPKSLRLSSVEWPYL